MGLDGIVKEMTSIDSELDQSDKLFLLLLGSEGGRAVPGDLWIQKEMFLIAENIPELKEHLDFKPHYKGPYSETVEDTLDVLEKYGLIVWDSDSIKLTSEGREVYRGVIDEVPSHIVALVEDVKEFANDLSREELLVYVYFSDDDIYEDMTTNSKIKEDLEQNKEEIAKQLHEKGKISGQKAAELAGLPLHEFKNAT
jgi:uncharacterized protein YwgA